MPEISRFYGIRILMYANDHPPSHFLGEYAGAQAVVEIETLRVIVSTLPRQALALVREWVREHQGELAVNWERLRRSDAPTRIDPLP